MAREQKDVQEFYEAVRANVLDKMRGEFVTEGISEDLLGRVKQVSILPQGPQPLTTLSTELGQPPQEGYQRQH
jgi:hypothetical protein